MSTNEKDSYGITVNSSYNRPILPEKIIDVGRYDVTIEKEGVITGGVLCTNIQAKAPFTITGSVLAMDSVKIESGKTPALIDGPLTASRSLLVQKSEKGLTACRIIGDASGNSITLNNTIVYGNILANKIILNNCIVLGDVHAQSSLELNNSFCFSFNSENVKIEDKVYILNFSAHFLSELELSGRLFTSAISELESLDSKHFIELTNNDISSNEEANIISCFNRITNLEKLEKRTRANMHWIENTLISFLTHHDVDVLKPIEDAIEKLFAD